MEKINVAGIVSESITDGAGIRFVLFVQGCPRRCEGCHNPQTLPFTGGQKMSAEEILAQIEKNPLLDGVTLSGGEPFSQSRALIPLAKSIKERGLSLAGYTGFLFEELISSNEKDQRNLLELLDILVDGEYIDKEKDLTLKFRGSKNQRFIDVQASLLKNETVVLDDWN